MKAKFGFAAQKGDRYLHMCFYEKQPTDFDRAMLIKELSEDQEFGLEDMVEGVDYNLIQIPDDVFDEVIEIMKTKDPEIYKHLTTDEDQPDDTD